VSTSVRDREAELPNALRRGLQAIRERVFPNAAVVAEEPNFVIVSAGTMTKPSARSGTPVVGDVDLPDAYAEDHVTIFARVSRNFPNADSYGVVTIPFLTRVDGKVIEWQHRNNQHASAVMAALGRNDAGFWSWNWQGAPQRVAEDLVAVVEWARRCIREGAR
jgi:hypothetical protein